MNGCNLPSLSRSSPLHGRPYPPPPTSNGRSLDARRSQELIANPPCDDYLVGRVQHWFEGEGHKL